MGLHHRAVVACQRHVHVTVPGVPGSDLRGQGRWMLPIVEGQETVSIHRLEKWNERGRVKLKHERRTRII